MVKTYKTILLTANGTQDLSPDPDLTFEDVFKTTVQQQQSEPLESQEIISLFYFEKRSFSKR